MRSKREAWNRVRTRGRPIKSRRNRDARSLDGRYTQDYRSLPLTSLTPPFIPLFVSRTRSNVVLSSLRPCRANRRAGVDIQATTMTGKRKAEREKEREIEKKKDRERKREGEGWRERERKRVNSPCP